MPAIVIIPLTPIPEFPSLAYRALGTYNSMAYTWAKHIREILRPELNAMAAATQANAELAASAIADTSAAVTAATEQADLAMGYRNTAASHASAASGSAGAAAGSAATAGTHAADAATEAGLATAARVDAQTARGGAETAQGLAEDASDAAAASAAAAQVFATQQLIGSSATSLTPAVGSKAFAMQAGRAFVPGMYLVATSTGAPTAKMAGYVTSYNQGTGALVLNVDAFGGTGAHADWAIGVAVAGQVGGITTQLLTAATTVPVVPNVEYIIGIAGVILDMTSTNWTKGSGFAISEAIGTGTYTVNYGTTKDRTRTRGSVVISAKFLKLQRQYEDATRGLI